MEVLPAVHKGTKRCQTDLKTFAIAQRYTDLEAHRCGGCVARVRSGLGSTEQGVHQHFVEWRKKQQILQGRSEWFRGAAAGDFWGRGSPSRRQHSPAICGCIRAREVAGQSTSCKAQNTPNTIFSTVCSFLWNSTIIWVALKNCIRVCRKSHFHQFSGTNPP